jgi:6-phosphogluconolactonase
MFVSHVTFAQTFAFINDQSQGVVMVYGVNENTGALTATGLSVSAGVPYGLAVSPSGKFLYTTDLVTTASCAQGLVRGFSIDSKSGALSPLPGAAVSSGGTFPVGVAITPSGKFAYAVNGCTNNISAYSINQTTGALTALTPSSFATGAGPTWITVDFQGRFLFVGNANSQDVPVYTIDGVTGALTAVPGSPFPSGAYPFRIAEDPAGRFLFVPNANSNTVAAFAINAVTGALTPVPGSPFAVSSGPQAAIVSASGQFLFVACGYSNQIRAFSINSVTGALTEVSGSPFAAGTYPYSMAESPDGKFLYVPNARSQSISGFSIGSGNGSLSGISGSPFSAGPAPGVIVVAKLSGTGGGGGGGGSTCVAADVTSKVAVSQGAFVSEPFSFGSYSRRITLTNSSSQIISGPLYLVFDGLPQTGTFVCPGPHACIVYPYIAVTRCNSPSSNGGSVYGPLNGIVPGGVMQTTPVFYPSTTPAPGSPYQMFNYTLRVFSGQPQ